MATAPSVDRLEPAAAPDLSHVSLEFSTFRDERGFYPWRLTAPDGSTLAQSRSFACEGDANDAARLVIANAASARLVADQGNPPIVFTHPGVVDSEEGPQGGPRDARAGLRV